MLHLYLKTLKAEKNLVSHSNCIWLQQTTTFMPAHHSDADCVGFRETQPPTTGQLLSVEPDRGNGLPPVLYM